jgi:NAD(P)-dependent dehydrogenase (short-subunit alcohol dehydrogenase family)
MSRLDLDQVPSLRGKRILISGGSRGIGKALSLAFLKDGARVSTCARREGDLDVLRKAGALAQAADVTDERALNDLVGRIHKEWGGLDALINNAAVLYTGKIGEQPLDEWLETLDNNLTGPLLLTRAALKIMSGGCVVNVTSGLARVPLETYGAYGVSKAGLDMLTRVLALELGASYRINALDPGEARTRMNLGAADDPSSVVPVARALAGLGPDGPSGLRFGKDGLERPW